jgi:hypothetical protein
MAIVASLSNLLPHMVEPISRAHAVVHPSAVLFLEPVLHISAQGANANKSEAVCQVNRQLS